MRLAIATIVASKSVFAECEVDDGGGGGWRAEGMIWNEDARMQLTNVYVG